MSYYFGKKIKTSFEKAVAKVTEALKAEGFGILTEIDVGNTLKNKLGVEFRNYKILGACNPHMAHKAISAEWDIGLLLPCNVIVYEKESRVWVGIMKPTQAMAGVKNDTLREIANEVEAKLKRVFDSM